MSGLKEERPEEKEKLSSVRQRAVAGTPQVQVAAIEEALEYSQQSYSLAIEALQDPSEAVREAARLHLREAASQLQEALWECNPHPEPEVHVIGMMKGGRSPKRIRVNVLRKGVPLVLVLTSEYALTWEINVSPGVEISQAILSGDPCSIVGLDPNTTIFSEFLDEEEDEEEWEIFWSHSDRQEADYQKILSIIKEKTGVLGPTSYQWCKEASEFTISNEATVRVWGDPRSRVEDSIAPSSEADDNDDNKDKGDTLGVPSPKRPGPLPGSDELAEEPPVEPEPQRSRLIKLPPLA